MSLMRDNQRFLEKLLGIEQNKDQTISRKRKRRNLIHARERTKYPVQQPGIIDFIESNDKVIQTLGVFIAITVFATTLPIKAIGYVLSFAFLSCTILILFELWSRFPNNGRTSLIYFENFLILGGICLTVYFLLDFRTAWRQYLFIVIASVILFVLSSLIKQHNIFNRLFQTSQDRLKIIRYMFGIFIIILSVSISFYISYKASEPINNWLDKMRYYIDNIVTE